MRNGLGKLIHYGFKKVGAWELRKNRKGKEEIKPIFNGSNSDLVSSRVIYAYVMGRAVKYIGICQGKNTTLKKRLNRHHWKTNMKLKSVRSLRNGLKEERQIMIYAWMPKQDRIYKWLSIDLVKGLESPLIYRFKTIKNGWNKQT